MYACQVVVSLTLVPAGYVKRNRVQQPSGSESLQVYVSGMGMSKVIHCPLYEPELTLVILHPLLVLTSVPQGGPVAFPGGAVY